MKDTRINPYWTTEEREERKQIVDTIMTIVNTIAIFGMAYFSLIIFG